MKTRTKLLAAMALAASLITTSAALGAGQQTAQTEDSTQAQQLQSIEGLPPEAPVVGTVITIDVSTNTAYLFQDGELVRKSAAATGMEKTLEHGDDMWLFRTPRGHLKVLRKIVDPVWRKPDWAFIEAGDPIPSHDDPTRLIKGHLGKYALDLGEGIMIHGTDDASSIGKRASHGCIRLPNKMLETVYKATKVGTDVYIFDSKPPAQTVERHSDLDYRAVR